MQNKNKFVGLSDKERLKKLAAMPDEDVDYSDIPDMSNTTGWKKLYPKANNDTVITDTMMFEALARVFDEAESEKIPVTLKLDRKVVDFFKEHSKKYQVKINEVLLAFVKIYEKSV
jgi:uncharacterized protein (DUF4415 family)